jgi:flagellar motility protein MotE (MotC chaperone)
VSIPIPQPRIPGAPNQAGKGRRTAFGRWLKRIALGLIALLLLIYLTGRLFEPARSLLVQTPGVGSALFKGPVWTLPDWLKPATRRPAPSKPATSGKTDLSGLDAELSAKAGQINLTQQAVDQKEKELKAVEARLNERQAAVEAREAQLKQVEANLSQLEVIRAMKPAAVTALFEKLSDAEVIALLRYMENEEVAQILTGLDTSREATLFRKLGDLKQQEQQAPAAGN